MIIVLSIVTLNLRTSFFHQVSDYRKFIYDIINSNYCADVDMIIVLSIVTLNLRGSFFFGVTQ